MNLLLLHGALGSNQQWNRFLPEFEKHFEIHMMEFEGHGPTPATKSEFSIAQFAAQLEQCLVQHHLAPANIFGYSMGGYVALYLAKRNPAIINRIMTLATKFDWTPESAKHETKFLNPDIIAQKVPAFAAELEQRHQALGWRNVLDRTAAMMLALGDAPPLSNEDLTHISQPVCICIGDRDTMVRVGESESAANAMPNATLRVFNNMEHPLEKVEVHVIGNELLNFISR